MRFEVQGYGLWFEVWGYGFGVKVAFPTRVLGDPPTLHGGLFRRNPRSGSGFSRVAAGGAASHSQIPPIFRTRHIQNIALSPQDAVHIFCRAGVPIRFSPRRNPFPPSSIPGFDAPLGRAHARERTLRVCSPVQHGTRDLQSVRTPSPTDLAGCAACLLARPRTTTKPWDPGRINGLERTRTDVQRTNNRRITDVKRRNNIRTADVYVGQRSYNGRAHTHKILCTSITHPAHAHSGALQRAASARLPAAALCCRWLAGVEPGVEPGGQQPASQAAVPPM